MEQSVTTDDMRDNWSRLWDWIAGTYFSPVETFREIAARAAWLQALVIVVAVGMVNAAIQVASALTGGGGLVPAFQADFGEFGTQPGTEPFTGFSGFETGLALGSAVGGVVFQPVIWTAVTAILFMVAYLLGGRGEFVRLWAVLGFAALPSLVLAPFSAGTALLSVISPGLALLGSLVLIPLTLAVLVWQVILYVLGVRETMGFTIGRATATVLLPVAIILLGILAIICVLLVILIAVIGAVA